MAPLPVVTLGTGSGALISGRGSQIGKLADPLLLTGDEKKSWPVSLTAFNGLLPSCEGELQLDWQRALAMQCDGTGCGLIGELC